MLSGLALFNAQVFGAEAISAWLWWSECHFPWPEVVKEQAPGASCDFKAWKGDLGQIQKQTLRGLTDLPVVWRSALADGDCVAVQTGEGKLRYFFKDEVKSKKDTVTEGRKAHRTDAKH